MKHTLIEQFGDDALLMHDTPYGREYIAATGYDAESGSWSQGFYSHDLAEALAAAKERQRPRAGRKATADCAWFDLHKVCLAFEDIVPRGLLPTDPYYAMLVAMGRFYAGEYDRQGLVGEVVEAWDRGAGDGRPKSEELDDEGRNVLVASAILGHAQDDLDLAWENFQDRAVANVRDFAGVWL